MYSEKFKKKYFYFTVHKIIITLKINRYLESKTTLHLRITRKNYSSYLILVLEITTVSPIFFIEFYYL